eukprot:352583-Chlamydomonas_euryale.AAC.2
MEASRKPDRTAAKPGDETAASVGARGGARGGGASRGTRGGLETDVLLRPKKPRPAAALQQPKKPQIGSKQAAWAEELGCGCRMAAAEDNTTRQQRKTARPGSSGRAHGQAAAEERTARQQRMTARPGRQQAGIASAGKKTCVAWLHTRTCCARAS